MGQDRRPPAIGARAAVSAGLATHRPVLLAAARAITLDREEAEDLVQATFEIALRQAEQLRAPEALRAWLLTIVTREALRWRRRGRRVLRIADVPEPVAPDRDGAERAAIHRALRRLPARMRVAVVLHHMVGLTVAETAEALSISPNTVKTQLKTGLARLREELRDG